jgi:HD-GYP domain-containing protein (c-di-GMP phosphodiesterase class II)
MTSKEKPKGMDSQKERATWGVKFFRAFYRLTQTVKTHPDNNPLLTQCAKDFVSAIARWCVDEDHLTIQISLDRFFLQNEKFHYPRQTVNLVHQMLVYFKKRGLQGLRFSGDIKNASLEQVLDFIHMLNDAGQQEEPLAWLAEKQEERDFAWVEIVQDVETRTKEDAVERKKIVRTTYSHALSSLKEVSQKIIYHEPAGVRKVKRIVQDMVDLLMEDDSVLLGMSTIKDYHDYTYMHSVNVAILSLCLGKRIGLSRMSLRLLGICGLVHDLGKVEIPMDILNKPGRLSEEERNEIEKHPLSTVRQVIKLRASSDLKSKILLAPFEHHLKYDLSGYPRVGRKKPVSLFGRILTIADVYDAMTSPRVYRPHAISPDRALGIMLEGAGKEFDPILLKVFINMLGVYPVGTLLRLDTGETGLVMDVPEASDPSRPVVLSLVSDGKGGAKKGKVIDLSERDPKSGKFLRNVKKTYNPSTFGIQAAEFLV